MKNKGALIIIGVVVLLNIIFFAWSSIVAKDNGDVTSRISVREQSK